MLSNTLQILKFVRPVVNILLTYLIIEPSLFVTTNKNLNYEACLFG